MSETDENRLFTSLTELGMDKGSINSVLDNIRIGHIDAGKRVLIQYRSTLLSGVHAQQDKLWRMDYIIRNLQGGTDNDF